LKLCCASFLHEFAPINIRMAKDQRQPLNPTKISGSCGRLLCCLKYEHKYYRKAAKTMPREGALVSTKQGDGEIIDLNLIKRTVVVILENRNIVELPVEEVTVTKGQHAKSAKPKLNKMDVVDEKALEELEDIPGNEDIDDDDD